MGVPPGVPIVGFRESFTCGAKTVRPYASHGASRADDAKRLNTVPVFGMFKNKDPGILVQISMCQNTGNFLPLVRPYLG